MSNKILLALAGAVAGLFFYAGYWTHERLAPVAPPVAVEQATEKATTQTKVITRVVTVTEPAASGGTRTTVTKDTTALENKVDTTARIESQPVANQRTERSRYSVGVLVTPRVDETWRDSYKPTAVELGYRLGQSPISAIGGYDWRRREFQLGVRVEW